MAMMLKPVICLVSVLMVIGVSSNPIERSDEDLRAGINLVFCTCDDIDIDGYLSLEEVTGQVCETVNQVLFGHQLSEQAFHVFDKNQDGLMAPDEVFDVMKNMNANRHVESVRTLPYSDNGKSFQFATFSLK